MPHAAVRGQLEVVPRHPLYEFIELDGRPPPEFISDFSRVTEHLGRIALSDRRTVRVDIRLPVRDAGHRERRGDEFADTVRDPGGNFLELRERPA